MILHLNNDITLETAKDISENIEGKLIFNDLNKIIITSSKVKKVSDEIKKYISDEFILDSDIQLSSRNYINETRKVRINNIEIGGDSLNTLMITGPCSIESRNQIKKCAQLLKDIGLTTLRAGCFKPRTSPYSFQGLGLEGLKMLSDIREEFGFILTNFFSFNNEP